MPGMLSFCPYPENESESEVNVDLCFVVDFQPPLKFAMHNKANQCPVSPCLDMDVFGGRGTFHRGILKGRDKTRLMSSLTVRGREILPRLVSGLVSESTRARSGPGITDTTSSCDHCVSLLSSPLIASMIRPGLALRLAQPMRRFASTAAAAGENEFVANRQAMKEHSIRECLSGVPDDLTAIWSLGIALTRVDTTDLWRKIRCVLGDNMDRRNKAGRARS